MKATQGKPIIVFLQVFQFPFFPKKVALMEWLGLKLRPSPVKTISMHQQDHHVVNSMFIEMAEQYPSVQLVDPAIVLCPTGQCIWREDWNILYKDDDHLSLYGAEKLRPLLTSLVLLWASRPPNSFILTSQQNPTRKLYYFHGLSNKGAYVT